MDNSVRSVLRNAQIIQKGSIWRSKGRGVKCQVINIARHGEDCTSLFVVYTNLEPTHDMPPGEIWTLGLDSFKEHFTHCIEAP